MDIFYTIMIFVLFFTAFKLGEVSQMLKESKKSLSKLNGCKPN